MICLPEKSTGPLYQQIYNAVKQEIESGAMRANETLPAIRALAGELKVSISTVTKAYQCLLDEGYIRSVRGAGYYAEDISKRQLDIVPPASEPPAPAKQTDRQYKYSFRYDTMDVGLFPWKQWREHVDNALLHAEHCGVIAYEGAKGGFGLRSAVCRHLRQTRGVNCSPEQIILSPGTQYAMQIILSLLPADKKSVAHEDPAHNAMRSLFLQHSYSVTNIPVTSNGIDMETLERTGCNIVYTMPSHQFPTGCTMPLAQRFQLLQWAHENGAFVIENDYDSEFKYNSRPIPSLQALDKHDSVIYFGTFSKTLTPSMRFAFFGLPASLLPVYEEKYRYFNAVIPSFHQHALTTFFTSGNFQTHLNRLVKTNEDKHKLLLSSIRKYLADEVEIVKESAGLHVLVKIPKCTNQSALIDALHAYDIGLYGTKEYWHMTPSPPEDTFILGFNAIRKEKVPAACRELAGALKKLLI